jgi:excisionase family DNA binding protein
MATPSLDPFESPTMTVEDLAELLQCGRTATYDAVRRGEIPSFKVGRRFIIPTAAVRRLLALDDPKEAS